MNVVAATAAPRWALMAEYATADALLAAARHVRAAGWRHVEAYAPFHVEGLSEAIGFRRNDVPLLTFLGGLLGGVGGFYMQWYSAVLDYPLDIGGRPLNSWPMFMPVTFELAVLVAAFFAFFAVIFGSGLPRLYHPVFAVPDFDLAMRNRFFLCLPADDPAYEPDAAAALLDSMRPMKRLEVPR
jgi:hypothetical protein